MKNMKKLSIMITFLSLSAVLNANPADPTRGYCQTVDPSVCGWGGGTQQQIPKKVINIPTHWGAVAVDLEKGIAGVSEDVKSERSAKRQAIKACKKRGGIDCKVLETVRNSCISYGAGTRKDSTTFIQFGGGKTTHEAEQTVVQVCKSKGGVKCEVFYSHCNKDPRYDMY